jgi:TrmH family RNA methyltransferase
LLRTADAANLDAVILADAKTELYNQNTIRSSVGCLFTVPVATGSSEEIINYLQEHAITFYAAALQDAEPYYLQDFNKPTAIVMGTEDVGLTAVWRQAAAKNIIIPMQGTIDSMNVSTSASVLIFEAKRQREFK